MTRAETAAATPARWGSDAPAGRALLYLLIFGIAMGSTYPLAKVAAAGGIPPLSDAFWQALGTGLGLLALARLRGEVLPAGPAFLRFYACNGLIAFALPNAIAFMAVLHLGAGLFSILIALSSLLTYGLAQIFGVERFSPRRVLGLALGLTGVVLIALPDAAATPGRTLWILIAALAPLSLALGNVYRALRWPRGGKPLPLAVGMLLSAAVLLAPFAVLAEGGFPGRHASAMALAAVAAQIALSTAGYSVFMELQRLGGPVYLSQAGYIIIPTGLLWGVVVFDEHFAPTAWAALALIAAGIALVNGLQRRVPPTKQE